MTFADETVRDRLLAEQIAERAASVDELRAQQGPGASESAARLEKALSLLSAEQREAYDRLKAEGAEEQFASEVLYAFAQPDEVRRELFGMSPEARGLIVADLAAIQAGVSEQPADAEQVVDRCVVELDSERRVNGLDADRGAELADKIVARYVVDGQIVASDQAQNGAVYTAASWAVRACRTAFDDLGYTPKEESEDFRALDLTVLKPRPEPPVPRAACAYRGRGRSEARRVGRRRAGCCLQPACR